MHFTAGRRGLRLAKDCCEMSASASRRDDAIVAWHEVPGETSPQKNRPVGHGMIGRNGLSNPRGISRRNGCQVHLNAEFRKILLHGFKSSLISAARPNKVGGSEDGVDEISENSN